MVTKELLLRKNTGPSQAVVSNRKETLDGEKESGQCTVAGVTAGVLAMKETRAGAKEGARRAPVTTVGSREETGDGERGSRQSTYSLSI